MKSRNKKGISLAVVLMVIMILVVIGFSVSFIGAQNLRNVRKNNDNVSALYAAEAGLARAVTAIRANDAWDGTNPVYTAVAMPNSPNITYSVRVYNNYSGTSDLPAENGIIVPAGNVYIVSEGTVGAAQNPKAQKKVGAMVAKKVSSVFNFALFAKDSLDFRGNVLVTAYDSTEGPYGTAAGLRPGAADVGTNASAAGSVQFHGGSNNIDGDVVAGPGSTSGTFIVKPNHWTPSGDFVINETLVDLPDVTLPTKPDGSLLYPAGPQSLPSTSYVPPSSFNADSIVMAMDEGMPYKYNRLIATSRKKPGGDAASSIYLAPDHYVAISQTDHNTYVLKNYGTADSPSVYVFDGMDLTGGAHLSVDNSNGPVVVVVNGNADLRGNSSVNSGLEWLSTGTVPSPLDIRMYFTNLAQDINIHGNPQAYAAIYAPNTPVWIHGNVDIFGSIVGQTIRINGTPDIYYDTALSQINDTTPPQWTITSRQRF